MVTVASTILFVVAKRRQWKIRESIRRMSRRLTRRDPGPKTPRGAALDRQSKRSGVRMASPPRPAASKGALPGHKQGLVANEKDVEKGPLDRRAPKNTKPRQRSWMARLWGNDWK